MSAEWRGACRPSTCSTCPFRGGFSLYRERRAEVAEAMRGGSHFPCHSEVDYSDDGAEDGVTLGQARQCAGATTVAMREGEGSAAQWLHEVLGGAELAADERVPFASWDEWINEPEYGNPMSARR